MSSEMSDAWGSSRWNFRLFVADARAICDDLFASLSHRSDLPIIRLCDSLSSCFAKDRGRDSSSDKPKAHVNTCGVSLRVLSAGVTHCARGCNYPSPAYAFRASHLTSLKASRWPPCSRQRNALGYYHWRYQTPLTHSLSLSLHIQSSR